MKKPNEANFSLAHSALRNAKQSQISAFLAQKQGFPKKQSQIKAKLEFGNDEIRNEPCAK